MQKWLTDHSPLLLLPRRQTVVLFTLFCKNFRFAQWVSFCFISLSDETAHCFCCPGLSNAFFPSLTDQAAEVEADSHSKFFFSIYRFLDEPSACLDTHGGRRVCSKTKTNFCCCSCCLARIHKCAPASQAGRVRCNISARGHHRKLLIGKSYLQ